LWAKTFNAWKKYVILQRLENEKLKEATEHGITLPYDMFIFLFKLIKLE